MSDPLRTDPANEHLRTSIDGDAERDAKIESLLLSGLDQYFASHYAQAIDIWTRALFLDRQHARARAYIERARSALAEQQRESEELLHNGIAAFERGEIEAARQLLNAAVQRGGAHDVALAFLTRIDRINAAAPAAPAPATAQPRLPFRPLTKAPHRTGWRWMRVALVVIGLAIVGFALASWRQLRARIPLFNSAVETDMVPVRAVQDPIVVPRSSETALDRAQALSESGRLYDALRALDLIRSTDRLRSDADKLKAAIQRQLLTHQTMPGAEFADSATPQIPSPPAP